MVAVWLTVCTGFVYAQAGITIVGKWKTIDDITGKEKSIIEVWRSPENLFYGKVIEILIPPPKGQKEFVCGPCEGPLRGQPVLGMTVIYDLKYADGKYINGKVLDTKTGEYFKCEAWLETANLLKIKASHWSGLSRTQSWYRTQ